MPDPRLVKLADILVNYSVKVKPGDWVIITAHLLAEPLLKAVYEKVVEAGGYPTTHVYTEELTEIFLRHANEDQLKWISPIDELVAEKSDASIFLRAVHNTRSSTNADQNKELIWRTARRDLFKRRMQRSAEGALRWTLTDYPCHAFAQDADMSLSEFEDFVYHATFADCDDPVGEWQKIHTMQQRLVEWLKGKKFVTVKGPNVEMSLSIEGRTFINSDGTHNMPSGEIFTGPVEDSVNGWVKFTYPAIHNGREVEGVELEFKDGKVVSARARKNEEFLIKQLDTDTGSRYLGEWAIGTNYGIQRFTKSILYDEKIGGTMHMAVGAGYPETGSKNESSIHWDLICDMRTDSEIRVDGELFYKDGQFQI